MPDKDNGAGFLPAFVLTVDSLNGSRREHCVREFDRHGIPFSFVEGVRKGSPESAKLYSPWRNLLWSKRSLSEGEVACYYGHRKAWESLLETGAPIGLIVEDDFAVLDSETFKKLMRAPLDSFDWDVLKLFDFRPKKVIRPQRWGGLTIVQFKYPASGNVAYLLTRKAALRLLARKKIYRPVDEDFSCFWEFRLRVRSVFPNIVDEISEKIGGSNLEDARKAQKLRKKTLRSLWGMILAGRKQILARVYRDTL